MGHKLDRAGWTAEANTEELTGEGASGKAGCALDDNLATYWHSTWQTGNWVSFPFEIIVDTKTEHTFTQIVCIVLGNIFLINYKFTLQIPFIICIKTEFYFLRKCTDRT